MPEFRRNAILVHKPHGSFNLFCNRKTGDCFFFDPSHSRGSVAIRDQDGGVWSPASAFVPPRLDKEYAQHPAATTILDGTTTYQPNVVTFWGVGLTSSDLDLMEIYRRKSRAATCTEFIDPDGEGHHRAQKLLGVSIVHHTTLKSWLDLNPA
jgi:hypothetical protein